MSANLDRSLDEILSEKKNDRPQNQNRRRGGPQGGGGGPRSTSRRDYDRQSDYPRDGVRKSYRDEPRNLDSEWVHDRYEDDHNPRRSAPRRRRDSPQRTDPTSSKIKVENIHYELTQEELEDLFNRIGPVVRFALVYDRAGRSEGVAYVTYENVEDAKQAIREFDGANANGQPIRLSQIPGGHRSRAARNPFDTAVMPGRPLSERVSHPGDRTRSLSPTRNQDLDDAVAQGIDRYVPGRRSRSPMPRRRGGGGGGGRRPGARREGGGGRDRDNRDNRDNRDQQGGRGGNRSSARPRKTAEELDDDMADYFNGSANATAAPAANGNAGATQAAAGGVDDIDMIE